jgi:predicted ester cyclase
VKEIMPAEENKAIVRRIYEEYLDELDPAAADELLAADVVLHGVGAFGEGSGRDNVKKGFGAFLPGFADRHTNVEELIAEGDRVVARHTHHLKHVDEVFGIPPTDQRLTVWGIDIFRFENGQIAEWWVIDDNLGMMQQMGVFPPPGVQPGGTPPAGQETLVRKQGHDYYVALRGLIDQGELEDVLRDRLVGGLAVLDQYELGPDRLLEVARRPDLDLEDHRLRVRVQEAVPSGTKACSPSVSSAAAKNVTARRQGSFDGAWQLLRHGFQLARDTKPSSMPAKHDTNDL